MNKSVLFAWVVMGVLSVSASLWNYDSASADIKEYVVDSITNSIGRTDIMLVHSREDDILRKEDFDFPCGYVLGLGLDHFRYVEMLMGNTSVGDYQMIYVYKVPRLARMSGGRYFPEFPDLGYTLSGPGGARRGEFYESNGNRHYVKGKEVWRFHPPYDPFSFSRAEEYVELRYMSPVHELKKTRIKARYYQMEVDKNLHDYDKIPTDVLMTRLGVAEAFSNRVYQAEEGCAFQVDYPVPEYEWKSTIVTKEEHIDIVRSSREENDSIMHLSVAEVSEIVCLSHAADKRYTASDYAAACKRCPKILNPVTTFKTEIGKRLKAALEAGGMLPKDFKVP